MTRVEVLDLCFVFERRVSAVLHPQFRSRELRHMLSTFEA